MKRFIFMLLVSVSMLFTGCDWFHIPTNAKRIGTGYIQNDNDTYFVEIDSVRYVSNYVFADTTTRNNIATMKPEEGMLVTCFTISKSDKEGFIVGDKSVEYLNEYFDVPARWFIFFVVVTMFFIVVGIFYPKKD